MTAMLILALLGLGIATAICLVSFAFTVVANAIIGRLKESKDERSTLIPGDYTGDIIEGVRMKNPKLADKLEESFSDGDAKMEFVFKDGTICGVNTIQAEDTSVDDFRGITNFYADGRIKQY